MKRKLSTIVEKTRSLKLREEKRIEARISMQSKGSGRRGIVAGIVRSLVSWD